MLKNKPLLLTVSVFVLWWVTGMLTSWIIRLLIDNLQLSSSAFTAAQTVAMIGWIKLIINVIGTYLIARYFFNQPTEKTKHFEQNAAPDEAIFHIPEAEKTSAKQR